MLRTGCWHVAWSGHCLVLTRARGVPLAGHFDISIGLTRMLIAGADASQPARDRTSFFINPRSETAPVVYRYAYQMVEGKTPAVRQRWWCRSRRAR